MMHRQGGGSAATIWAVAAMVVTGTAGIVGLAAVGTETWAQPVQRVDGKWVFLEPPIAVDGTRELWDESWFKKEEVQE